MYAVLHGSNSQESLSLAIYSLGALYEIIPALKQFDFMSTKRTYIFGVALVQ